MNEERCYTYEVRQRYPYDTTWNGGSLVCTRTLLTKNQSRRWMQRCWGGRAVRRRRLRGYVELRLRGGGTAPIWLPLICCRAAWRRIPGKETLPVHLGVRGLGKALCWAEEQKMGAAGLQQAPPSVWVLQVSYSFRT